MTRKEIENFKGTLWFIDYDGMPQYYSNFEFVENSWCVDDSIPITGFRGPWPIDRLFGDEKKCLKACIGYHKAEISYQQSIVKSFKNRLQKRIEENKNIKKGQEALARGLPKLFQPGVKIRAKKDVPLYYVDPNNVNYLIQILNGRKSTGHFVDGVFVELGNTKIEAVDNTTYNDKH